RQAEVTGAAGVVEGRRGGVERTQLDDRLAAPVAELAHQRLPAVGRGAVDPIGEHGDDALALRREQLAEPGADTAAIGEDHDISGARRRRRAPLAWLPVNRVDQAIRDVPAGD